MRHQIRWTLQKLHNRLSILEGHVYRYRKPLPPFRYRFISDPNQALPVKSDFDDSGWDIIQPLDYWAYPRTNFVLRTRFCVPEDWSNHHSGSPKLDSIALYLPIGIAGDFSHPEALAFIDGTPFAACDRHHQEIILPNEFLAEDVNHTLVLHGWTGIGGATFDDLTNRLKMGQCEIVYIDQTTRNLLSLARVSLGVLEQLDDNDPAKHHLLTVLDESFQHLDLRVTAEDHFYLTVQEALEHLQQGIKEAGPPLGVQISAIGHAHIDVAWLWTLEQTRQKASRTYHNMMRYFALFPEFHFVQSQPQLYDFIRQDFPLLFKEIQARVREGRWEPIGGMWVEADCNLTGPESLVRQFLLGRSFYKEYFGAGADSPVLWLPDVFGYAWNLPQLIKEAGLKYFFTIKIGWNQYNRLPFDSFWWQGLDGTKVLTHFSTTKDPDSPFAATYNSDASPAEVVGTWVNFQQKDYGKTGEAPPILMSFGYGDGGGGPTHEMLENIQHMANFPSTPQVTTEKVISFFRKLEAFSECLPTWNGELYLEYHRGTYTTHARNKKANRQSEFALHDAEFLATFASLLEPGYVYPKDKFQHAWELVCLNQFHDIIPGSSIGPVYNESLQQYEEIRLITEDIKREALGVLSKHFNKENILANPTSFRRNECLHLDDQNRLMVDIAPYSVNKIIGLSSSKSPKVELTKTSVSISKRHLENELVRVELNQNGDITRILDKRENREVLPRGSLGNQFQAFEDIPLNWDAWDIDIFYDEKMWLAEPAEKIEVIENHPLRSMLRIKRKILKSEFVQYISLSAHSPRIDFNTKINWKERQTLLKVAFPVDILSPTATYEIQWGNVQRPTHRNTSWDWARFETAAQKWVDLSEGGYGVSLLNDCKYGHDIHENIIRLTLLRGTTSPDPTADLGEHTFQYCLLPHQGRWGLETVRESYAINDPLIVKFKEGSFQENQEGQSKTISSIQIIPSLIRVNQENIVIETIKRAEDGKGIIIRLYEYQRKRGEFTLQAFRPIQEAWRTNLLEENREEIETHDDRITYRIQPFQILTLRLVLQE